MDYEIILIVNIYKEKVLIIVRVNTIIHSQLMIKNHENCTMVTYKAKLPM